MKTQQKSELATVVLTEKEFRDGIMPRAQLSVLASRLAIDKATQKNAKEFAGFELLEAETVVKLLADMDTAVVALNEENKGFIEKLKAASGNEFDRLYMEAELSNHEFLRDLAKNYLEGANGKNSEKETQHIAMLALYAFTEHVALCKRIYGEVIA